MLNCPYCKTDLAKLDQFPEVCPGCGKSLMTSDEAHASVQLVSESGNGPGSHVGATLESTDSQSAPPSATIAAPSESDDAGPSQTMISDEWSDPVGGQTVALEENGGTQPGD